MAKNNPLDAMGEGKVEFSIEDFQDFSPAMVDAQSIQNAIEEQASAEKEEKNAKAREYNKKAYAKKTASKKAAKKAVKKSVAKTDKSDVSVEVKEKPSSKKGMPKYLNDSDYAVHLVMKMHMTDLYKRGASPAPLKIMGNNAYGKECKKNAYERLALEQQAFKDWDYKPEWIIITRDDVTILDTALIERLKSLKPHTHVVGPIGVKAIRRSGKFFAPDTVSDIHGMIIQGSLNNEVDWSMFKSEDYDARNATPVAAISAGFIAVRYQTFMEIDFDSMAQAAEDGFYHYAIDICLHALSRNRYVGVIKTIIRQADTIAPHSNEESFQKDHRAFVKRWASILPVRI